MSQEESPDKIDRKKEREKLKEDPRDFEHRLHNAKMSFLNYMARKVLPGGFWSGNRLQPGESAYKQDDATANSDTNQTTLDGNGKIRLHLTFDDGPDPGSTPALLNLLAEKGVIATFFFIGANAKKHTSLVKEVQKAGQIIGNHSMNHLFLPVQTSKKIESEIDEANQVLEEITGERPSLFRPPFGLIDRRGAELLAARRMSPVYWGAVADDWQYIGEEAVTRRILKQLPREELIVLHEGPHLGKQTVNAAALLIDRCLELGFSFDSI
ncbi:MAG: polysaccharide deacetylase family protein [Candidatus Obscuribacterales bacterium]|nr:polysaccharide deacetylase family protein [Candidatus Obscuribacterales bacterium]